MWRERNPHALLMGILIGAAIVENSMEVPLKLKIELSYDPAILFLGKYPEKSILQKDTCTPMPTAALFTIAKTLEAT